MDNNCNGTKDVGCCTDSDGDGFSGGGGTCGPVDCNDSDASIYPGAPEICDGVDNDCDRQADEGLSWDLDGDGHYSPNSCRQPADDCSDGDPTVCPEAAEVCGDDKDNDCDGEVDEGCCDLTVDSFAGSNGEIHRKTGGTISLRGSISDSSGEPVNWAISVAGQTFIGSGRSPSVDWDGKDSDGKVVEVGTYTASLQAARVDKPDCSDNDEQTVTVTEAASGCALKVTLGSSANVASGELTDSLDLFSVSATGPNLRLSLHYGSQAPHSGPLGLGWSHSYDIFLTENAHGEMVLHEGNGGRRLYTPGDSGYASQPGDDSALSRSTGGTFLLTKKSGTAYAFGADGRIAAIVDRNGNALTFVYDGDLLATVTDPDGRSVAFGYDASGRLATVTAPAGRTYAFTVGESLEEVAFPDGATWSYGYAPNAFLTARSDPLGNLTTYIYDDAHRVVQSIDPEGRVRAIAYPEDGEAVRTTTFTEKDGGAWAYRYDTAAGDLLAKTDPEGNTTSYTYDANHNRVSKTDAAGATYYTYDAAGDLTSVTDVAGQTTRYTYNTFGQVTSITAVDGAVTNYAYDERGNLTSVAAPDGAVTAYAYDGRGRLVSTTDPLGRATAVSYDAAGNVASVTGPDGQASTFTYDAAGHRASAVDAAGNVTRYRYDAAGRLVDVLDAAGQSTRYGYDAAGNRTSVTDGNGNVTTFAYDFAGQMTAMTDAMGFTTTFAYGGSAGCSSCGGGVDKLTALTDARGQSTLFKYDPLGRLTRETDPLGHVTEYDYDAAGRVASKTDPKGQTIHYSYDPLGRLTAKLYPDGSRTDFAYDAAGNLTSAANGEIAYTFAYDAGDRLTSVSDSRGTAIGYSYDAAGNRTSLTSSNGIGIDYAYDDSGRLARIDSQAGSFNFGYDELGRRASLEFPNGVATTYAYDDLGRLTDLVTASGAGLVAENRYTHDAVGNRLSNRDVRTVMSYTYDAIYRLTAAEAGSPGFSAEKGKSNGKGTDNASANQREFYRYDPVGNRTASSAHAGYTHNAGNELLAAGDFSYSYDANGNRSGKTTPEGTTLYSWDYENRLSAVDLPNGRRVTFAYDPFGRRIAKTADGVTTLYTYDGEDLLFETVDGAAGNVYVHGPGIDEPLALLGKKGATYYHSDGLGSIVAMTDDQARNVQQYEYDSFGNQHDMKNHIKQPYGYTGREHDLETGLHYYRARYYDGEVGVFLGKDPIGFQSGDVNFYSYVGNAPTNLIDPRGLFSEHNVKFLPGKYKGIYDFDMEDNNPATSPYNPLSTWRHFRSLKYIKRDFMALFSKCKNGVNKSTLAKEFSSLMHQGQDYFSHYANGFRATTFHGIHPMHWGPGHILAGTAPDNDQNALLGATLWSKRMIQQWENCECQQ